MIACPHPGRAELFLYEVRLGADGTVKSLDVPWGNVELAHSRPVQFIGEEDLVILRSIGFGRLPHECSRFGLRGTGSAEVLQRILATARAFIVGATGSFGDSPALRLGSPRRGSLE